MKKALVTGITGQDGSYLAEILLEKSYEVHGIVRRSSSVNRARIDHLREDPTIQGKRFFLHYGDVTDTSNLNRILEKTEPDEIYNLAAQSHVKISFEIPEYTAEVDAIGTLRFLDAIRETGSEDEILPGLDERALRQGADDTPKRKNALLSQEPVRSRQAVWILDRGKLP